MFGVNRVFLPTSDVFPTLVASDTNDYVTSLCLDKENHETYKQDFLDKVYFSENYRKITREEACVIQGFPKDFELTNEFYVNYTDPFGNTQISKLVKTIDMIKENLNPNLKINGIVLTMYDKRNSLSSLIEDEARKYFDTTVYKFNVPRNVKLSEAPSHGLPAIIYDLKCSGSQAYIGLAREFIERNKI